MPAIRALRRTDGGRRVVLAAQPRVGALLEDLGVVDGHVAFDALRLDALFVEDAALRPSALVREARGIVCWFGSADPVFARRLGEIAPGAVVASPSGPSWTPVWEHLVATAMGHTEVPGDDRPGVDTTSLRGVIGPGPHLVGAGRQALLDAGWDGRTPLLLLHPGAGGEGKRWPPAAFAAVVGALTRESALTVAVHAGPADHAAVAAVRRLLATGPGTPGTPLALVEPSLGALAGALGHASLYLGNDSGVSHLAAAVGVPSVVLFMRENLRFVPWSAAAGPVVVSREGGEAEERAVLAASRARLGETGQGRLGTDETGAGHRRPAATADRRRGRVETGSEPAAGAGLDPHIGLIP